MFYCAKHRLFESLEQIRTKINNIPKCAYKYCTDGLKSGAPKRTVQWIQLLILYKINIVHEYGYEFNFKLTFTYVHDYAQKSAEICIKMCS